MFHSRPCFHMALALLWACGRVTSGAPPPEAGLADSSTAQQEFRDIERQWVATAPQRRKVLAERLTRFVQSHPTDGQSRRARLYLAWLSLQEHRLGTTSRWLDLARTGAEGVDGDLLEIIEAGRLLASGEPHRAYARLKPLEGQLLNRDDSLLYFEQVIQTALRVEREHEALQAILNLATQSARKHRDRVWTSLKKTLEKIPTEVLKEELQNPKLKEPPLTGIRRTERSAARRWLQKQIRTRLSRAAIEDQDVRLAQKLMARGGDQKSADSRLETLAREAENGAHVDGRSLGLVLDLSNSSRRQHSIELSTGISIQLRAAQVPSESRVSLLTRSVQSPSDTTEALRRLVRDGAALLVAGLDAQSADEAARYAEDEHILLLLLHPESVPTPRRFVRVIGSDFKLSNALLHQQLRRQGARTVTEVGHAQQPCPLGPSGDGPRLRKQLSSKPPNSALLLSGSAACGRSALDFASNVTQRQMIGIGLASLGLVSSQFRAPLVLVASAGHLPFHEMTAPPELLRWVAERSSPPTWHEALGHDVALIAQTLFPLGPRPILRDPAAIETFRTQLMSTFTTSKLPHLWTSLSRDFDANGTLARTLQTVQLPSARENETGP